MPPSGQARQGLKKKDWTCQLRPRDWEMRIYSRYPCLTPVHFGEALDHDTAFLWIELCGSFLIRLLIEMSRRRTAAQWTLEGHGRCLES